MTRTLTMTVMEWPAVAAGFTPAEPGAVMAGNRVAAVTEAARSAGVRVGLRRREAQARCPELQVVPADEARDAREFEPVLAAITELCPRLEVLSPGCCTFPTRGPSRYFGGDRRLALRVKETVEATLGGRATVRVGVADDRFTARVAADSAEKLSPNYFQAGEGVVVIPAGGSADWLANLPVSTLAIEASVPEDLVDLFRRLGLVTLGLVAAQPAGQVLARFGFEGALAHRLASGLDDRPAHLSVPTVDTVVELAFETPVERAEAAGFAAGALAAQLEERLSARGLSCTLLLVVAETEHEERSERRWRLGVGPMKASVAERVRWQLDGWLNGPAAARPSAGVTLLRLVAEEVSPAGGSQLQLWNQPSAAPQRVVRAIARLEGLFGPDAVTVPEWRGGRQPGLQAVRVPAATVDLADQPATPARTRSGEGGQTPPWPGMLPPPSPTVVFPAGDRALVEVLDERGERLRVDGRSGPATPATVAIDGRRRKVAGWAGPWPLVERWWDPDRRCRQARLQVLLEGGDAHLLVLETGRWWLAGVYD
ncbi:MAG: DNA polymerase Y family protein [Acidimicrobiales bacterium]|nr:DNA polymerase Y family protein [Acidimicrobiales bacterium]